MNLIDSFLEYLLHEKKYSLLTVKAYKNDLTVFKEFIVSEFDENDITKVDYNQIRGWIIVLVNKNLSNRSINRKISSLKSFYKFLQKSHQVEVNPLSKHKALKTSKKVQVPFTYKEVNRVIYNISEDSNFVTIRNKLIVELFYSTGIRRMELINIKLSDVNLSDKTIKVLGKRNKERFVPILNSVNNSI